MEFGIATSFLIVNFSSRSLSIVVVVVKDLLSSMLVKMWNRSRECHVYFDFLHLSNYSIPHSMTIRSYFKCDKFILLHVLTRTCDAVMLGKYLVFSQVVSWTPIGNHQLNAHDIGTHSKPSKPFVFETIVFFDQFDLFIGIIIFSSYHTFLNDCINLDLNSKFDIDILTCLLNPKIVV